MTRLMLAASMSLGLSLGLTGCFGPGDPVELPEGTLEAAQTCLAAQTLVWGEDKEEGDAPSYAEFSKIIHYPMLAAAQTEPFTVDTITDVISGAEQTGDEIELKDYAGVIPACEAKFAVDNEGPTLPEGDSDAFLSCLSMSAFMAGVVQEDGVANDSEIASVTNMVARLEARLETDPELLVKMVQNDGNDMMEAALKVAFAQGNPANYLGKCEARFPAD